jgi:transposase
MTQSRDVVGIDVGKDDLEIYALPAAQARRVANTAAGHAELARWLKALGVTAAVMEASGGYERTVARALRQADCEVRVVDPKRVRHFAKALGRLAKNDRIDARVIAEFGAVCARRERCEIEACAKRDHLAALLSARQALIEHQTALRNQICTSPKGAARSILAVTLPSIVGAIKKLDRAIAAAIAGHPPFAALSGRLKTVPCLGPVVIAAIIAWLPELGRLDRRALAALVGVAPFDDDSGKRNGQRSIKDGRRKLRNILYMAVMSGATMHNPLLKAHYMALINRGKLPKVAIIACMRKLLTILNVMVARQIDWQPKSATALADVAA